MQVNKSRHEPPATQRASNSSPRGRSDHLLLLLLLPQQSEVSLDPGVAGQQVLGGVENLLSLTAGQQQLVCALTHPHLEVQLFLYIRVLLGQKRNIEKGEINVVFGKRLNPLQCCSLIKTHQLYTQTNIHTTLFRPKGELNRVV